MASSGPAGRIARPIGPGSQWAAGRHALTRTKLLPPRAPRRPVAIDRHNLWIEPILVNALCLVRAPSGYGKSTLCVLWHNALAARGCPVGWVSFEPEDDSPARALHYMFEALRIAGLPIELAYDALSPPQSLAAQVINAVLDFGRPLILFLDDIDRLTDHKILQFFNYLLIHCPENLHLVCACQAEPELPLLFLETHGMLVRVSTEELRLTAREAHDLLADTAAALGPDDARRLNDAMGGWVTGLRIGSAALRNNRDALLDIGLVSQGAHWMSDYLDENIFQHLTPDTRVFLTRCAIVETMTADLCRTLSGQNNAAKLLIWLADQNLFLQRLDDAGTHFRIHPVFREFLLTRLVLDEPDALPALHRAASDWFAADDQMGAAIGHALDGGDTERAARLVNLAAREMLEHSDIVALLGWIARIPDDVIADYLDVRLAEAWAMTLTLRPKARQLMDDIAIHLRNHPDTPNAERVQLELAGIQTIFLAVYDDRLDAAVASGYRFLGGGPDENSFVTRAVRNAVAYCELERGNATLAYDVVRPSQLCAMRSEQLFTTAYRHCIVGLVQLNQGEAADAERIFQSGLTQVLRQNGRQSASAGLLSAFVARSLYERGAVDQASAILSDGLPVIDEAAFHEAVISAYVTAVRIAALHGDTAHAAALLDHVELIGHERQWRRLLAFCAIERVRLRLPLTTGLEGLANPRAGARGVDDLLDLELRIHALVVFARCLEMISIGDFADADRDLAWLRNHAVRSSNVLLSFQVSLMKIARRAREDHSFRLGGAHIEQLSDAVARGFGRTIIDGLVPLAMDQRQALLAPVAGLDAMMTAESGYLTGARREQSVASANVFTVLTSREIEVLSCVSRGESNKEIARRLHLTPETVKWHMKNILRKLSCESRAEAVAHATLLGLAVTN